MTKRSGLLLFPSLSALTVSDPAQNSLGYKQVLHRKWRLFESFASAFAALYFVGGIRVTFSIGVGAGGPLAYWTSYLITCVFVAITAAVLAEVCSALPAAGSIYFWAAAAGGRRWGRLFGCIVAWWSCTAWTTFIASNAQGAANYILSEITVFGDTFTTDVNDIKFRAVQWIVSEGICFLAIGLCFLPPKVYTNVFRVATGLVMLDFFLNIIWLPIGVSKTYGFQDKSFLLQTYNQTGAPPVWNWMLSYYVTAGVLVGFEASGHISEETQDASITSAKGIFYSAIASAVLGFPIVILFLFCTPDLDTLYSFGAPQPFVNLYAMALGKGGQVVMIIVVVLGTVFNTSVAGVASSRLIWAVARDGVLPFSGWIAKVGATQEPRNAVVIMLCVASLLLCTILPSPVAFTSLVSAAGVPTITAYALIAFGRTFLTPHEFKNARWSLGRWSRPMNFISFIWNTYLAAVLFSPIEFPVSSGTFNYSCVIFGAITIFGIATWWFTPEDKWLPSARLGKLREMQEEEAHREAHKASGIEATGPTRSSSQTTVQD
ncbi:putative amino acid permease [Myriangium duriaei CBS 260.36]|uniref:Amino acid permease n=1 Tax=Myriangium duriaei CBS 260.36 TaxID=1168546 RepID=A0A9P4J2E6_9PEZI|nr:putative amino acid permease [Myriangium duriaei CBS 260.36]